MPIQYQSIPLTLYIHLPWCVQKCPYCDFNSHRAPLELPEKLYIKALQSELISHLPWVEGREIKSIFFGGGTPSLFSVAAIDKILSLVNQYCNLSPQIEITLEANPGTVEQQRFKGYFSAGINRISLGIQSFNDNALKDLGRIHDSQQAKRAIESVTNAGFKRFNLDIMYALPKQTLASALTDLEIALSFKPEHLSWYQLTLEPNTLFYHQQPQLPSDDESWDMQLAGQELLAEAGLHQYEVSAYAKAGAECRHNLNYWQYGDYLGIGAGAHSKITNKDAIYRLAQVKHPKDYLEPSKHLQFGNHQVDAKNALFELVLNAMRLTKGISVEMLELHTGLVWLDIQDRFDIAIQKGLLERQNNQLYPTALGRQFTNELVALFLPN